MVESNTSRIDFFMFFLFCFLRFLSERGASEAQKVSFYRNNGTPKKRIQHMVEVFWKSTLKIQ